jgi:hypothetical protein
VKTGFKVCFHIQLVPLHPGFINKASFNRTAAAASGGTLSRPSDKDSMLLSALDQYGRGGEAVQVEKSS